MPLPDDQQRTLTVEFVALCQQYDQHVLNLNLRFVNVIAVIAHLQLAVRHPDNNVTAPARSVIAALIQEVGKLNPRLAELLEMGNQPDVRRAVPSTN